MGAVGALFFGGQVSQAIQLDLTNTGMTALLCIILFLLLGEKTFMGQYG